MSPKEGYRLGYSSWAEVLSEHREALDACDILLPSLEVAVGALRECLDKGGKVLVCGNGGSHAHAQHFAAELVVRFKKSRDPIAAMALGSNAAVMTAVMNDFNPRDIFVREVKALLRPNDTLLGISTSGISVNVCRALVAAHELGAVTMGLTGQGGMGVPVDHEIRVPSPSTPRIQEIHMIVLHWLCECLDVHEPWLTRTGAT